MNQPALVEAVSKSGIGPERLQTLAIELPQSEPAPSLPILPPTPESDPYQAINRRIARSGGTRWFGLANVALVHSG
jgi:hypothetical protein